MLTTLLVLAVMLVVTTTVSTSMYWLSHYFYRKRLKVLRDVQEPLRFEAYTPLDDFPDREITKAAKRSKRK